MKSALVVALLLTTCQAHAGCTTWATNPCTVKPTSAVTSLFSKIAGEPTEVVEVKADSPTPLLTGYDKDAKRCDLLVNVKIVDVEYKSSPLFKMSVIHEAGHCLALRSGISNIDVPSINDEKIADVFATAWVIQNLPTEADELITALMNERRSNRMISRNYDTLFAIVRTRALIQQYPTADAWSFTLKQFQH